MGKGTGQAGSADTDSGPPQPQLSTLQVRGRRGFRNVVSSGTGGDVVGLDVALVRVRYARRTGLTASKMMIRHDCNRAGSVSVF